MFWFQIEHVPSHNRDTVGIPINDPGFSAPRGQQISSIEDHGDALSLVQASQTILLIDDTESLLQLQALELEAYGYEVAFLTR